MSWRRMFDIKTLLVAIVVVAFGLFALDVVMDKEPSQSGDLYASIDNYVRDQMDDSRIPGLAIAIVEDGKIVHAQGLGDDGRGQYITPQTPFRIGSNTKSFTALSIMQLVEAGRVDLEAPVQRYVPEFTVADHEAASRITIHHLLNQTSGISRDTGLQTLLGEKVQTLDEAVADLATVQLNREVGASYEYSNANFVLLGLAIERVTGRPWSDYVEAYIFEPLGMSNTFTSQEEAEAHGLTEFHRYVFGVAVETEPQYLPGLVPTGWIYSTAEDMTHYLTMYLNRGVYDGARLLSASGIDAMLRGETNESTRQLQSHSFDFQYGRGWFVGPFGTADDARWHLGNLPYFTAWMVLLPDSNQGVVVLMNAGSEFEIAGANSVMSRIPLGIVDMLRGEAPPEGTSITRFFIVFDAVAVAILSIQVWSLVHVARRCLSQSDRSGRRLTMYALPLTWEIGVAALMLMQYPKLIGAPWVAALNMLPDLTLVVFSIAALWLATGAARTLRLIEGLLTSRRRSVAAAKPRTEVVAH